MVNGQVILKNGRDKNVRAHHPWVFSGAVDKLKGKPQSGETVEVRAANGDLLGLGAWSPASQIQVRLWTFADAVIDRSFFLERIRQALAYRQQLGIPEHNSGYRLVNAESDGLPGVVVDKFGDWLVMQCLTAGAEHWKQTLADALLEAVPAHGVYERSDVDVRKKEGLENITGTLRGTPPPACIDIEEAGRRYRVDAHNGHKTGFYLDQRDNRSQLQQYASGKTVLNCFAYTGGFAIAALHGGAEHAVNIDASQPALELAAQTAALNGFQPAQMENVCGDVFKLLREYRNEGRQFDIVVLDPPKFADNRNQLEKAARGYKDINLLGFKLLKPGGLLFTFSCSGLMESNLFQKIVADAAVDAGCDARILRKLDQAADHPTRLAFPEGYYLKGLICQK
ncbi:class I SAM-dependent methyltransferase [Candidatus Thiothrix sp. Deng01]|uniref:Class I SAM-dependent methyltransferase n=1 Tax=Candidatus Thiothrix phosphatis TaxID=3112415 RepID=A0ABU6D376_9GAMM|nr:class I SAM-dependent methyltransferase [Candidatus Thiothrix sp. Deng01]MEB4593544.1 class I SAM-dependent methyltransferase [Candidatus Thiothrix sp. Deng01]